MVDAALLEIEGVLFDTRRLRRASLQDALLEHGIAMDVDADLADALAPRTAAAALLEAEQVPFDEVMLDLIAASAERLFAARIGATGAALAPGALDFVREGAAMARLAIVTRARRSEAEALLRLASIEEFIGVVVTADDVVDGKPSPEGHLLALERLNRQRPVASASVIALEDGAGGIAAAHRAGVRCVAIGPSPAHVVMEADAYVESLVGHSVRSLDVLSRPGRERVQ
ncbi:MAG TPA: HAD family phosphatase [Gemmatimonadaceae bacterium]|nr:HAD family phosphatase [Gemmatimonadaceae bacterium]